MEICDQAGHLGQGGQLGEGRAALEVDQHEGELVGRVGGGQAGDDGAQQLALPRAGGPDDQAVGADAALGRLLEVEHQRLPARACAHRHLEEPRPVERRQTAGADLAGRGPEQVAQAYRVGTGGRRLWPVEPQRRQPPGEGLAERQRRAVGPDAGDQATTRAGLLKRCPAVVVDPDPHRELGRLAGGGAGEPDHGDAAGGGAVEQLLDRRGTGIRRRLGHVEDCDQVRPVRGGARVAGVG